MATQASSSFDEFKKRRQSLVSALNAQAAILVRLGLDTEAGNMRRQAIRTDSDDFKVMVIGEFNRGKSTLINALLGQKVLPAYHVPTTAIINEVKWGQKPAATLYWIKQPGEARQRVEGIQVERLEDYVVAKDGDVERPSPYEKVVLEWPLDLLDDGVELVDAPGLNANAQHELISKDYVTIADAVVFVIACDYPFSKREQETVAEIRTIQHHEDIFFVCNGIDKVEDEKASVQKRLITMLAPLTRAGARHVYFVSATQALRAQINHETVALQESGVPQVERDLKDFLSTQRSRMKLVPPALKLQESVGEAQKAAHAKNQLEQVKLQELQARYDREQAPLQSLAHQAQDIDNLLTTFRAALKLAVHDKAVSFFRDLATKSHQWLEGWTPENGIGVWNMLSETRKKALMEETIAYLKQKADAAFMEWEQKTLRPLIQSEVEGLKPKIEPRVTAFGAGIAQIKVNLTGSGIKSAFEIKQQGVEMWQRIVGGLAGLLLGDIFNAGFGVAFGLKSALTGAAITAGALLATVVLTGGLSAPVVIPVLIASAGVQALFRADKMTSQTLNLVADHFSKYITDEVESLTKNITVAVDKQVEPMQQSVNEVLQTALASLREQVESVLREKERGQASAEELAREMSKTVAELDAQGRFAAGLVSAYAQTK